MHNQYKRKIQQVTASILKNEDNRPKKKKERWTDKCWKLAILVVVVVSWHNHPIKHVLSNLLCVLKFTIILLKEKRKKSYTNTRWFKILFLFRPYWYWGREDYKLILRYCQHDIYQLVRRWTSLCIWQIWLSRKAWSNKWN